MVIQVHPTRVCSASVKITAAKFRIMLTWGGRQEHICLDQLGGVACASDHDLLLCQARCVEVVDHGGGA